MICITCPQCSTVMSTSDSMAGKRGECPVCHSLVTAPLSMLPDRTSQPTRKQSIPLWRIASFVIVPLFAIGWFAFVFGGGLEQQAAQSLRAIQADVAADAIEQYNIAKRNGSAIDAYVQAGIVVAAFLQLQDESNYQKWKQIQEEEARRAGMPVF